MIPVNDDTLAEGKVVDLPEWKTRMANTVAVGQAARFAVLKPATDPGKFVVDVILR